MSNINGKWQRENTYDAIVIGSGISGGWAAKELTEKGLKTLVLERGRMIRHVTDYPTMNHDPWELKYADQVPAVEIDKHYQKQNRTGFTIRQGWKHWFVKDDENPYSEVNRFDWIRGYQVGGRSIVWGRQVYRWSDLDFEANAKEGVGVDWPIRYQDIAPWYDYVEEYIGVSGEKTGLPHLPDGKYQPPMEMNCVELMAKEKIEARFGERKVIMGHAAHITSPTATQQKQGRGRCQYRDLCMRGCPYGAYFSSNASTLLAAEATGKMTLRPHSIVRSILFDPVTRRASGVKVLDAETKEEMEFYARVIFLNASTLNSAWILLNSATEEFPTGLGNSSDQLGRNVMDHHFQVGASGIAEGFEDRYYKGRRPNGIYIPRFRNLGDAATRRKDFLRGYGYEGGASRSGWQRLVAELGFGAQMKEQLTEPGQWSMGMTAFGEMLPHPDNRITLNKAVTDKWGLPTLTMDVKLRENELAMRKDMRDAAVEMLEAAGLKEVSGWEGDYAPGLGIHEMGTARMGRDPRSSVLNANNQMHDVANVFITDGACMASTACQNPSLIYMALTARAVDFALKALNSGDL